MNERLLVELRAELVKRIRETITPDGNVSEELQEATLQALCIVAGTVFAVQRDIPVEIDPGHTIGKAALDGMTQWHEKWIRRN